MHLLKKKITRHLPLRLCFLHKSFLCHSGSQKDEVSILINYRWSSEIISKEEFQRFKNKKTKVTLGAVQRFPASWQLSSSKTSGNLYSSLWWSVKSSSPEMKLNRMAVCGKPFQCWAYRCSLLLSNLSTQNISKSAIVCSYVVGNHENHSESAS